jgi:hypothetical protein
MDIIVKRKDLLKSQRDKRIEDINIFCDTLIPIDVLNRASYIAFEDTRVFKDRSIGLRPYPDA